MRYRVTRQVKAEGPPTVIFSGSLAAHRLWMLAHALKESDHIECAGSFAHHRSERKGPGE